MRTKAVTSWLLGATCAAAVLAPAAAAQGGSGWYAFDDMAVAPDGRHLYGTSSHGTLSFGVDAATGALTPALAASEPPGYAIAATPEGSFVYVAGGHGIHVLSRDSATGLLTHERTVPFDGGRPSALRLSPDGRHAYLLTHQPPTLLVMERDPATGDLMQRQGLYGTGEVGLESGIDLAVAPDGRDLYVVGSELAGLRRNVDTGMLSRSDANSAHANGTRWVVAVSPDGRRVYAGRGDYSVWRRDPATGSIEQLGRFSRTPHCSGCDDGTIISPAPDGGAVFSSDFADPALVQAAPTDDGVAFERRYVDATDGEALRPPAEMTWSPGGRYAYIQGGSPMKDNLGGAVAIVAAYRWTGGELEFINSIGAGGEPFPTGWWYPSPTMTIDDGALFTNDLDVEVAIEPPIGTFSLRLSNTAGDFTGAPALRYGPGHERRFPWRLDPGATNLSVKRVHARFTPAGRTTPPDLFDDIVLDQRPPQILSARIRGSRLKLRARDNRSGVKRVQVTADRRKPGRARGYERSLKISASSDKVYIRVFDGAGNRSGWRSARRR